MMRSFTSYVLALALMLSSFALAGARGDNPDLGQSYDMVICTGVGMTTITIGPDGEPIESVHLCPDGASIFAAAFDLPAITPPQSRLIAQLSVAQPAALIGRNELSPSARGPPALV